MGPGAAARQDGRDAGPHRPPAGNKPALATNQRAEACFDAGNIGDEVELAGLSGESQAYAAGADFSGWGMGIHAITGYWLRRLN